MRLLAIGRPRPGVDAPAAIAPHARQLIELQPFSAIEMLFSAPEVG